MSLIHFILPLITVPGPSAPPGADSILKVLSWIMWGAAIAGVIGLIAFAISMFFSHNRGQGFPEHGGRLLAIFGGLVLVGAAGGIVTTFIPA